VTGVSRQVRRLLVFSAAKDDGTEEQEKLGASNSSQENGKRVLIFGDCITIFWCKDRVESGVGLVDLLVLACTEVFLRNSVEKDDGTIDRHHHTRKRSKLKQEERDSAFRLAGTVHAENRR